MTGGWALAGLAVPDRMPNHMSETMFNKTHVGTNVRFGDGRKVVGIHGTHIRTEVGPCVTTHVRTHAKLSQQNTCQNTCQQGRQKQIPGLWPEQVLEHSVKARIRQPFSG